MSKKQQLDKVRFIYYPIIYISKENSIAILDITRSSSDKWVWSRHPCDKMWEVHLTSIDEKGYDTETATYHIHDPKSLADYILENNYRGYTDIPGWDGLNNWAKKYNLDFDWIKLVYNTGNTIGMMCLNMKDGVPEFNRWAFCYNKLC